MSFVAVWHPVKHSLTFGGGEYQIKNIRVKELMEYKRLTRSVFQADGLGNSV